MAQALETAVRVRFAPSPTGFLHVGGARTAIYNDLLRQRLGGAFILRIEDTDKARSDEAMTRQIQSALAWIGVEWDEGPFLQSERLPRHSERAAELLAAGKAYRCFATNEELEALRTTAEKEKGGFRYKDHALELDAEAERVALAAGRPFAVLFRMPSETIHFQDLVRGAVDFPPEALDDFIILRSDGSPTYHMSVVCDDIDMGVTHVIRGDDHLSNTPKHIGLFRALGSPLPTFGHLPLILGPDRKRLSKRIGSTSVEEFRNEGILPQALYNFLALLGWSPGGDRELMSRSEMVALFDVEGLNTSAAVFDREKLLWMNGQYLLSLPYADLAPQLGPFLAEVGLEGADPSRLERIVDLYRPRAKTLRELVAPFGPYFSDDVGYQAEDCQKFLADTELPARLEKLAERYAALEPFDTAGVDQALRALAEELGVKAAALIHPTRMALTATTAGPSLFDVVAVMGKDTTVTRLRSFAGYLERNRTSASS